MTKTKGTDEELRNYLANLKVTLSAEKYHTYLSNLLDLAKIHAEPYLGKLESDMIGEAYWVLTSESSTKEIEKGLPILKGETGMPNSLELILLEDSSPELEKLNAKGFIPKGNSGKEHEFYIKGSLKGESNKQVAGYLSNMLSELCELIDRKGSNEPPFDMVVGSGDVYYISGGGRMLVLE